MMEDILFRLFLSLYIIDHHPIILEHALQSKLSLTKDQICSTSLFEFIFWYFSVNMDCVVWYSDRFIDISNSSLHRQETALIAPTYRWKLWYDIMLLPNKEFSIFMRFKPQIYGTTTPSSIVNSISVIIVDYIAHKLLDFKISAWNLPTIINFW